MQRGHGHIFRLMKKKVSMVPKAQPAILRNLFLLVRALHKETITTYLQIIIKSVANFVTKKDKLLDKENLTNTFSFQSGLFIATFEPPRNSKKCLIGSVYFIRKSRLTNLNM